ncbi:MAG: hypothetical protein ACRC2R_07955 [Xenococcaceae cyanobacterium]
MSRQFANRIVVAPYSCPLSSLSQYAFSNSAEVALVTSNPISFSTRTAGVPHST